MVIRRRSSDELPYRTKFRRTKFSSDKIFRRTKLSKFKVTNIGEGRLFPSIWVAKIVFLKTYLNQSFWTKFWHLAKFSTVLSVEILSDKVYHYHFSYPECLENWAKFFKRLGKDEYCRQDKMHIKLLFIFTCRTSIVW